MRVVQLITQDRGGPVDHAVDVAGELSRQGHESHLVAPLDPDGPTAGRLRSDGVHLHAGHCESIRDVRGSRDVARLLQSLSPDVVHGQDRRAGLVSRAIGAGRRVPTVYTLHGVPDSFSHLVPGNLRAAPGRPTARSGNLLAEGLLARTPMSRVITPCEAIADYARRHLHVPSDRVHAVHNGIGPTWLDHRARHGDRIHEGPPGRRGELVVAWLGVLAPVKRVPALVEAVAAVPGCRLILVGDGPERGRVEDAVRRTGTEDRVELRGFTSDPARWIAEADVLVLPSAAEACPMALLQAMALGLPVVASSVGGIPEVVRDGIDGLLVPAGDDAALRASLTRLRDTPRLRHALGTSAARRVRDRFTLERCVGDLVDVYREVSR